MVQKEYKLSYKNQFRSMVSLTIYRIGRKQCIPLETPETKFREFYVINQVLRGSGTFILNGMKFPVKCGDTFLIYPNIPINYIADFNDPWEFSWIGFNGPDVRMLIDATSFSPQKPVITLRQPEKLSTFFSDIYNIRGNKPYEIIRMTALLYNMLAYLIEENDNNLKGKAFFSTEQIQHACDFIAEHFADSITVQDVANELGICRSQLFRIFKEQISMSPQKYLREFRIGKACILLADKRKSINEIAYAAGFKNQMYFTTVFKSSVGMTPSAYRKTLYSKP